MTASSPVKVARSRIGPEVVPPIAPGGGARSRMRSFYRAAWWAANLLLVISIMAAAWFGAREYSTRRYLKGFSDAIIPFSSSPVQKVQAILQWMAHSPNRVPRAPASLADDRDPTDTLNYASLLQVCGTATNAFVNLSDSGGLTARRLLLLDSNQSTVHVTAEVFVDGRWVVVDPTFRTILRGPDASLLTREQLRDPAVLAFATRGIAGYDPSYVFDRAVHIHLARLGFVGRAFRRTLDRWFPGWDDSPILSLLLERESLCFLLVSLICVLFLIFARSFIRLYGETRLGVNRMRFRNRLLRASQILLEPAD